jgi:hypothetical protein
MNTTDSPLNFVHADAYKLGLAGLTLAAALALIAEDSGVVLTEVDFHAAISGHAEGARRT